MKHTNNWHGKPYYSLDAYLKNTYGEKIYKIALDAGFTCPNRDGTLDTRGCIFCSSGGSGDFAVKLKSLSVSKQIEQGLALFHNKNIGNSYIAYFQAFTNTYAPVSHLRELYTQALSHEKIRGISIATRPDCLSDSVLTLLSDLKEQYPNKFIWIELGLQTIHEETAKYIRRGYPLATFEQAVNSLRKHDLPAIVHVILGLPGETKEHILQTIDYLNKQEIQGIKLQLLHILKYTDLAFDYAQNPFHVYTLEEYIDIVITCIEHLREDIVIHRLTGDGPKELLIAPLFSLNKRLVLNTLHKEMKLRNSEQGKDVHYGTGSINPL